MLQNITPKKIEPTNILSTVWDKTYVFVNELAIYVLFDSWLIGFIVRFKIFALCNNSVILSTTYCSWNGHHSHFIGGETGGKSVYILPYVSPAAIS